MTTKVRPRAEEAASWVDFLQDISELGKRLGTGGMRGPAEEGILGALDTSQIDSPKSLSIFLKRYSDRVLVPIEIPTITEASLMVGRGEFKELLDLDQRLAQRAEWRPFADASRWVGSCHARSMRGMKDHRTVWRYCEAIRTKQANGWHAVVYGVVLSAFSIPLRQGISNYCDRTLGGFVDAVALTRGFSSTEVIQLKAQFSGELAPEIDRALAFQQGPRLKVV